uniref:Uncharacterized protein n=1 Tax=Schistocephalus solidus TaxID=70667 RepID=A0A0X3PPX2_SCHSO
MRINWDGSSGGRRHWQVPRRGRVGLRMSLGWSRVEATSPWELRYRPGDFRQSGLLDISTSRYLCCSLLFLSFGDHMNAEHVLGTCLTTTANRPFKYQRQDLHHVCHSPSKLVFGHIELYHRHKFVRDLFDPQ